MLTEQNFYSAAGYGTITMIACSLFWGTIIDLTGLNYGFLAIVNGFIIGYVIRHTGKGIQIRFGILAAILATAGYFFGKITPDLIYLIRLHGFIEGSSYVPILLGRFEYEIIDFIIIFLAIGIATRFAFRKLTKTEKQALFTYKFET